MKRTAGKPLAPRMRRAILAALRNIASDDDRPELSAKLKAGRTIHQDAGEGRVERIERDGTRTIGRFVNRVFIPEEPERAIGEHI